MPIIKSAKKAARQATKRKLKNTQIKKDIKLALKTFKASPTAENMKKVQSEYDKAAKKGLIKKNTASRRKSSLAKLAKSLGVKPEKAVKKAAVKAATKKTTAEKKPVAKKVAKVATKAAVAKTAAKATAKKAEAKTTSKAAKAEKKAE